MPIVADGDNPISSRSSTNDVNMPPAPKNGSIPSDNAIPPDTYSRSYVYTTTVNHRYTRRLAPSHSVRGPVGDG